MYAKLSWDSSDNPWARKLFGKNISCKAATDVATGFLKATKE